MGHLRALWGEVARSLRPSKSCWDLLLPGACSPI